MTDTADVTEGAVETAATEIAATEAVEQHVVPAEDVSLETGTSGDEAQQPLTKREARRAVQDDRRAQQKETQRQEAEDAEGTVVTETAEAATDETVGEEEVEIEIDEATGRKRDVKTGQFLSEDEDEGKVEGEVAADSVVADEASVAEVELIEVPIPEDHPLFKMGQPTLTAATHEQELVIRAFINGTYERVKAVEARDQLIATRDATIKDLREEKVRREASQAAMGKFEGTEAYKAHKVTYETLAAAEAEGTVPAGTASAFWHSPAVQQDVKPLEDAEYKERMVEVEAQAENEAGELFIGDALRNAQAALPPEVTELAAFKEVFDAAIDSFDAELERGLHQELMGHPDKVHDKFSDLLRIQLVRNEPVRRVLDAKLKERDRAEKAATASSDSRKAADTARAADSREKAVADKAVEDAKREAADTRRRSPTHPLGKVADAHRGAGEAGPTGSPSEDGPDLDKMTAHQLKRHLRKGARTDARRHATRA